MKKLITSIIFIIIFGITTSRVNASVTWATHTVVVQQEILTALDAVLTASPPDPAAVYYAITDVSLIGSVYVVSIAALDATADPADWNMYNAVWLGTAAITSDYQTAALEGSAGYDTLTIGTVFDEGGGFTDAPVFPWQPGTKAYYGSRGVHAAGYGRGDDWYAVDWVSGPSYGSQYYPNAVYGSIDSEITYVCRDDTSVAVIAGDFLYAHLEDNASLNIGFNIRKNVMFASLVESSFTDTCGWAAQNDGNYHIHFGFIAPTGKINIEGWILDTETQIWTRNGSVEIGDSIMATGINNSGVDNNGDPISYLDGGHFWDAPINSIINIFTTDIITRFPKKLNTDLAKSYYSAAAVAIRIFYIFLKSSFNLSIFIVFLTLLLILEPVRVIYGIYRMIKDAIPLPI